MADPKKKQDEQPAAPYLGKEVERVFVQATKKKGHKGRSRAGRFWPSDQPVAVVVFDTEKDPPDVLDDKGKSTRHSESPRRIGQESLEAIQSDDQLSVKSERDPAGEAMAVKNLRAQFDAAWADLKRSHAYEIDGKNAHIAELEAQLAKVTHPDNAGVDLAAHEASTKALADAQAEITALKEHADGLEKEIADLLASKPAEAPTGA